MDNKSLRNLSKGLAEKGYKACHCVAGEMLKISGGGLQEDRKTLTVTETHAGRGVRFEHINEYSKKADAAGIPVISLDAKKKENIGNFRNKGKTYQPYGNPVQVPDHDFPLGEPEKVTPSGVYNIFKNQGFVSAGVSCGTAVFSTESIRKWWYAQGKTQPAKSSPLRTAAAGTVIETDCGNTSFKAG